MLPTNREKKLEQNLQARKTKKLELNLEDLGLEMPQDRGMDCQQSSRDNLLSVEDCKEFENLETFTEILDTEMSFPANWDQWDTYCEDLTKYTKLTSCDIWGTKEVDYLGLDDFSSPYQDEEVISKTPTLAQLNSEDSQPVSDPLCYSELLFNAKQTQLTSLPTKKIARAAAPVCSSKTAQAEAPLSEFAQKASKANSSTQIMVKTNMYNNEKVNIHIECKDYVKKAKVKISPVHQHRSALNQANADAAKENTCYCGAVAKRQEQKGIDPLQNHSAPVLPFKETQALLLTPPQETPGLIAEKSNLSASTSVSDPSQKKEEHNYSLFVSDGSADHAGIADPDEDEDDEEEVEDEDHDEGFGSEHELSENDEEEDYEDDKDDDISDTFSEPGFENDSVEDLKEMTAISCRKRGKRRYFWEYSEQLTPSQQERMLRPSEWNRETLPSNMYQKNGLHHGKYAVKKSRRTDVEDLTPNPKKLLQIGNELRKLNKVISDLTPVSELPLTARPRSRKEKNKLASRACRLKKKAQYEANKVKLWGLNTEYDNLLFVINSIKQEIVNRVQSPKDERVTNMSQKLDVLIKDTLGQPVSGQTSEFVNQVLEKTAEGDPTGGLVGLRIPTSKI
ncbi:CREB3 regulatory factor isoform X3 [Notechis scutatus]|uniref:CREB3 regulatory factor isoform X3 n=1 Tax=Notechis scutatus TaxID=8663 RepID=A0A6J1VLM8_9SAUR|nr:CREB3 regulatory factor isoform X3 [Notechis scutatus]